ncbi:hypothetical protein [Lysobacter gummosus]
MRRAAIRAGWAIQCNLLCLLLQEAPSIVIFSISWPIEWIGK